MRFVPERKLFEMNEAARVEDLARDETSSQRMVRICLPAMNSINEDLNFTVEVPDQFETKNYKL